MQSEATHERTTGRRLFVLRRSDKLRTCVCSLATDMGESQRQIATKLNISKTTVCDILKKTVQTVYPEEPNLLSFAEHQSIAEIAQATGISKSSLARRIARVRRKAGKTARAPRHRKLNMAKKQEIWQKYQEQHCTIAEIVNSLHVSRSSIKRCLKELS